MGIKKSLLGCFVVMAVLGLLVFVGCAPQAQEETVGANEDEVEETSGEAPDDVVLADFTWKADTDCAPCHAVEVESQSNSAYLASTHATEQCLTCHANEAALQDAHEGANPKAAARAGLKATSVPEETCLACHDKVEIAQTTSASTVLTDVNGLVINPHELPESADHEALDCNSCHQMHVSDADLSKKSQRACGNCHHADVYECYTCHS